MKRTAPLVRTVERPCPSNQPVSCQLCRSRKLKCDRGHPCYNCSSRSLDCVYNTEQRQNSQPPFKAGGSAHSCEKDCSTLSQRIRRLESAVFPSSANSENVDNYGTSMSNLISGSLKIPTSVNQDEEQQRTSEWFEGLISARVQTAPGASSFTAIFRDLPTYEDAELLLDIFIKNINSVYHIFHVPTTKQHIKELYENLHANNIPSPTQLAFALSIFAGAVYVSKNDFSFQTGSLYGRSQTDLAELWLKQAVFLLTQPPVPSSTQALQTLVFSAHFCTQIEGFTGNFGLLSTSFLQMAKSMKVNRLDIAHTREERKKNGADMVDVESKRRIWWHAVASDWLLSTVGGPSEGTYTFHPNQMEVLPPSNVDDDHIPIGTATLSSEEIYNLPLDSPTSISYFLHRIQVAHLSREVTDSLPPSYYASPETNSCDEIYNRIINLDRKYQQLLKTLPPFFQLTNRSDTDNYKSLIHERPYLEWQRYLINFVIYTHLARLHRPFLIRGSTQPKFAYSRMQCIRSAETVLEIRKLIGDRGISGFNYVLSHFMMAAVILAMDVCFNPDEICVPQRKEEVLRACRALEEELNGKITSHRGSESETLSSCQLMLKSFQKAVQNLRALLRKKGSNNQPQATSTSTSSTKPKNTANISFTAEITLPPKRQAQSSHHSTSTSKDHIKENDNFSTFQLHHTGQPTDQMEIQSISSSLYAPPLYEDLGQTQTSIDHVTDELWNEFFSVGPTFNNVDWDSFLLDIDNQMAGG